MRYAAYQLLAVGNRIPTPTAYYYMYVYLLHQNVQSKYAHSHAKSLLLLRHFPRQKPLPR